MGETLIPTHGLRLLQSRRDDTLPPVLQQCYINPTNGKQVWHDVPVVYGESAVSAPGAVEWADKA